MYEQDMKEMFLFVIDEDKFLKKIFYDNILYIETIKSSHYCSVVCRDEKNKLKADIKALVATLPNGFYKCRSSTIINLEHVKMVDLKSRVIYFENNIFCDFSNSNKKHLKELLHLYSYRCSGAKLVKS